MIINKGYFMKLCLKLTLIYFAYKAIMGKDLENIL